MFWRTVSAVLGIAATLLVVLAIAVYEGYIPLSFVDNLSATELGTLGVLAGAAAIGAYVFDGKHRKA